MIAFIRVEVFHRLMQMKIGDKIDLCLYTPDHLNPRKQYEILEFIVDTFAGIIGITVISDSGNIVTLKKEGVE